MRVGVNGIASRIHRIRSLHASWVGSAARRGSTNSRRLQRQRLQAPSMATPHAIRDGSSLWRRPITNRNTRWARGRCAQHVQWERDDLTVVLEFHIGSPIVLMVIIILRIQRCIGELIKRSGWSIEHRTSVFTAIHPSHTEKHGSIAENSRWFARMWRFSIL